MKHLKTFILALLCAIAGATNTARAASREVTYHITSTQDDKSCTLTFVRSGDGFGYSTGTKTVTITNITTFTGFQVQLDDGLYLQLSLSQAGLSLGSKNGHTGIWLNYSVSQNAYLALSSTHYYVTHVKMADLDGTVLTGFAAPWTGRDAQMDTDVDMVTENDALNFRSFSANITTRQNFAYLTVTYGDPREYPITFDDVEGLLNPNPASYNVTTDDFDINAPTRTGYTLSGTTYTDGLHPYATAIDLSMTPLSISRGDAVQRKAITFVASWTANQYTVTLDNQGATTAGTTEVTATYDAAMPDITPPSRTGYRFGGYFAETNAHGTQYYNGSGKSANNWNIAAATTLYANWNINSYSVCFDANGGSGSMANLGFRYGEEKALTTNTFTRTGYTFSGWNTAANGSGTSYTDGQSVSNLTATNGATVYLYAQWATYPPEAVAAKPATCTEPGISVDCWRWGSNYYSDEACTTPIDPVIPALGHDLTHHEAVAATEGVFGNYEHWTCSRCGKYFSDSAGSTETTALAVIDKSGGIYYIDSYGTRQILDDNEFEIINKDQTYYGNGDSRARWYIVYGDVTFTSTRRLVFYGATNLILCDDAHLTVNNPSEQAIYSLEGEFNIYGQTKGNGHLEATSVSKGALEISKGSLTIYSGNVTANNESGNGIYVNRDINIYGGKVTAKGTEYGMKASYGIHIGWTNPTDHITASSYFASDVGVMYSQALWNGEEVLYNSISDMSKLDGKTLQPYGCAATFAKEGYSTYYDGQYDLTLPAGMKAYVVTGTESGSTLTYVKIADGDDDENKTVPAGTAVLLQAAPAASSHTIPISAITIGASAYTGGNLLHGSDTYTYTSDGEKYYKLSYNSSGTDLGWYYGALGGATFFSQPHKAWLALPAGQVKEFLGLPEEDDADAIRTIDNGQLIIDNEAIFNLAGQRINKMQRGINIVNGKKILK